MKAQLAGLLCLAFVQFSCGYYDNKGCKPNDRTICREGEVYWVDSCGEEGNRAEVCDCGCNEDFSACQEPCVDLHNIAVGWTFGPHERPSLQAAVYSVRVQLFDDLEPVFDEEYMCSEHSPCEGAILIGLADGLYRLVLSGLNNDRDVCYLAEEEIEVAGVDQYLGEIELDPVEFGDLTVGWTFSMSDLDCADAGVSSVRIGVYAENDNPVYISDPGPNCEESPVLMDPIPIGFWNIVLEGVCNDGTTVGYSIDFLLDLSDPIEHDLGTITLQGDGCP